MLHLYIIYMFIWRVFASYKFSYKLFAAKIKEEDTYEKNFAKAKIIISKIETKLGIENGQTNTTKEGKPETKEKNQKKEMQKKLFPKVMLK